MKDNELVCKCMNKTVKDIKDIFNTGKTLKNIIELTGAGNKCKCCLNTKCSKIDISLIEVYENLKKVD